MKQNEPFVMELPASRETRETRQDSLTIELDQHGNLTLLVPLMPTPQQERLSNGVKSLVAPRRVR